MSTLTSASGPRALNERSLAPDLARGAMLLFIALANAPWYLWGRQTGLLAAHPKDTEGADLVVQTISLIAIDGRTYPMFAFLFGYGIWQLYSRQLSRGVDHKAARKILMRRHWWMLVFGGVHAALLWMGDIVGAYGLAGLVLVAIFLRRSNKVLIVWASIISGLLILAAVMSLIGAFATAAFSEDQIVAQPEFGIEPIAEPNYLLSVLGRLTFWLPLVPLQALLSLTIPAAILLAFLAARAGVLENPQEHRKLLTIVAIAGISVGWLGGAAVAAQNADLFGLGRDLDWGFLQLYHGTGLACGLGYVAAFALLAARLERNGTLGWLTRATAAIGKRSLTFYLAQSLVFAPVMSAWGFGLGNSLGNATIWIWALGVWLLSLPIAMWMEQRGLQGPAERLLRFLVYRSPARARHEQGAQQPEPKTPR